MNKMAKGAAITGLGVALLLGGGGTLAVWNAEQSTNAGVIASGQLDVAPGKGVWTDANTGTTVDIKTYRVVPGDSLTYTQPLTVTLEGNNVSAVLSMTGTPQAMAGTAAFDNDDLDFTLPTLVNKDGKSVLDGTALKSKALNKTETLTASSTVTFDADADGSMNAAIDLNKVSYRLDQQKPGANGTTQG
ncbi:alternate-type signal peptide domain-containing protein [Brachybacterium sp. UNK5269]|uniref:alternate-type signal peptide domain-containing protein n=1 Tax=Brachybacterium sp. UNK5269 TaxID=3408576 RepID=UPI003BB03EE0